ncbi:MAG: 3'(2'),5'-bisphosphate nucleotidase CysQ [Bacteroidota bacterium]
MNTNKLLHTAINAAIKAGEKIMEIYNSDNFGIRTKKDNSPLTLADQAAHDIIISSLSVTCIPVLSEEGINISYSERSKWNEFWLVDPLDGTKEFIRRNGEFTVNIALISNKKPVAGVIFIPVLSKLYFGSDSTGSFLLEDIKGLKGMSADAMMKAAKQLPHRMPPDDRFIIVASRSHMNKETEQFIEMYRAHFPVTELISCGSSLKICLIAEGYAHIYPRFGPTMEWDIAAGHAIAKAAGCFFTGINGDKMCYNKESLLNPFFIVSRKREYII